MSFAPHAASAIIDEEQRLAALKKEVQEVVSNEGGEIIKIIPVGLLFKSPFPALFWKTLYLRVCCKYPSDIGEWIVCHSPKQGIHWCWKSNTGNQLPPVQRNPSVMVKNDVICLPEWTQYIVAFILILSVPVGIYYLYKM
jgi:hypothetical protein